MSLFDDREKAYERKFQQDEERKFKISSRAAHLFGLWAANEMELKDDEAEAYARRTVELSLTKNGGEAVIDKVENDLKAGGIGPNRRRLEKEFDNLHHKAEGQIRK
jgi:hypothetical protein